MKSRVAGGRCVALAALTFGGVAPGATQAVVELPANDRHIEVELEELGRIGDARADWDALTLVTSLSFDAAGRLYVGDLVPGRGLRILVVTASGDLLDEFGGSGRGPGEFGSAMEAVALAEGGVAVPDPSRGGYHIFDHPVLGVPDSRSGGNAPQTLDVYEAGDCSATDEGADNLTTAGRCPEEAIFGRVDEEKCWVYYCTLVDEIVLHPFDPLGPGLEALCLYEGEGCPKGYVEVSNVIEKRWD